MATKPHERRHKKPDWSTCNEEKKGFKKDERYWKPTTDEQGNAFVIMRFIPDPNDVPFNHIRKHNFNYMVDGVKKYYIKNCINTFGFDKECPLCKKNNEYYNSAFKEDKELYEQRKAKHSYTANVLIIQNANKPEDEGKVFLFEYGNKIADKIKGRRFPSEQDKQDPDFKSFDPFDWYEGADFKLKVKKVGDYPNYDDSTFSNPKEIGSDDFIDSLIEKSYDLSEFMDVSKFPTNEETAKVLSSILGIDIPDTPVVEKKSNPKPVNKIEEFTRSEPEPEPDADAEPESEDEDDDDVNFFKNLR